MALHTIGKNTSDMLTFQQFMDILDKEEKREEEVVWGEEALPDEALLNCDRAPIESLWDIDTSDDILMESSVVAVDQPTAALADKDLWAIDVGEADLLGSDKRVYKNPCPKTVPDFMDYGMNRPQAELWVYLVDVLSIDRVCPIPVKDLLWNPPRYLERLSIMTFAYVNGCDQDRIIEWYQLCGHLNQKPSRAVHLQNLKKDLHSGEKCGSWYSYHVFNGQWEYTDGRVRQS